MKAVYLGLCLSLLGSAAMAQTAVSGSPPPPAARPPQVAMPPQGGPEATAPSMSPGQAMQDNARPGGPMTGHPSPGEEPYEGEIVQTPDGTYVVTDHPEGPEGMAGMQDHPRGPDGPDQGMGPPPHPHGPMMRPRESKAAHIRMKGPDLGVDIKCPDDEPVKACADAVMPLLDKVSAAHH